MIFFYLNEILFINSISQLIFIFINSNYINNLKIRKITGYKDFKNIKHEIPLIIKWFKENNISTLLK